MLRGYKSYILAGLGVLYGVLGFILGYGDTQTNLAAIWAGLAVFGLRQGIHNEMS